MHGGERLDLMGAADGLGAGFGQAEVLYFAFLDEVPDGAGDVFDGDFGVDTVLVEQVDGFDFEPLEGAFGGLADVLGPAVEPGGFAGLGIEVEAELGGDDDFLSKGGQCRANEFFVGERAVDFRSIEEGDAAVDGGVDDGGHFLQVAGWPVAEAHPHAAEAEGRDFEVAVS